MLKKVSLDKPRLVLLIIVLSAFIIIAGFATYAEDLAKELPLNEEKVLDEASGASDAKLTNIEPELDKISDKIDVELDKISDKIDIDASFTVDESMENSEDSDSGKLVDYVIVKNGKKEIEAKMEEGKEVEIFKSESVDEDSDLWKKRVTVSSDEHFDSPVTVYADIIETDEELKVLWIKEDGIIDITDDRSFDLTLYDQDDNGLNDRISFIAPHLSVQNFDIIINLTQGTENSNLTSLSIEMGDYPQGEITNAADLDFDFNVSYSNLSNVDCSFDLKKGETVKEQIDGINMGELNISTLELDNGNYNWKIFCKDEINSSINDSESNNFDIMMDYSPIIAFTSSDNQIIQDEEITFNVNVTGLDEYSLSGIIIFGDGGFEQLNGNPYQEFSHEYSSSGEFTASLSGLILGETGNYNLTESIEISVTGANTTDEDGPTIELNYPSDEDTLDEYNINFSYEAHDVSNISNCTFNLFYFNSSSIGELVYDAFNNDVDNNEEVIVQLVDFDEGDYTWEVECYDTKGNRDSKDRDFNYHNSTYSLKASSRALNTTFERAEEIDEMLDRISEFLIDSGNYGKEEQEAMDDLGLVDDALYYKKKLSQIKLDLQHNLDHITDEDKRDERRDEINSELDEIAENIPENVEVLATDEFIKNKIDSNIRDVIRKFLDNKNIILSKAAESNLIDYNAQLQNSLSISVNIKHVEIEYAGREEKITLVRKTLDSHGEIPDTYLEVIPEEISKDLDEVSFLNINNAIDENNIYEIKSSDLIDGKIVYYMDKIIDLAEVRSSDTFAFHEDAPEKGFSPISAFAILPGAGNSGSLGIFIGWLVFILVFLAGGFYAFRGYKTNQYKSRPEVLATLSLIKDSENALSIGELSRAKDNYVRMAELYSSADGRVKPFLYKRISSLRVKVDKKEVQGLINECLEALRQGRTDIAMMIYSDIQSIYNRMPGKFRKKIYEKMVPYMSLLNNNTHNFIN